MPVEYNIDHEARFVMVTGRGHVVLKDILDCMHAVAAQDAMAYPKLFDVRNAIGAFSDDEIMTMGAWAQAYASYDPRGAVGIVATTPKSIQNMSRFMNLATGNRPIRLFTVLEEAQAWLQEVK